MSNRDANGRFVRGASGNPNGRPSRADELRSLMQGEADAVAKRVLKAAEDGDMQACRLILERCVPAIKPASESIMFDLHGDTLTDQAQSILTAVAGGQLPPDQGKALLDALANMSKISEIDEVKRRLDELEGRQ